MEQQHNCYLGEDGASGRIRTSDRSVRSRVLYPAELRMHRETCFTADIDTAAKAVSSKRWCIREDDSLGSPFGPLLKQRYPPWRWRLSRRPWNNSITAISEKMVHPGGFEPPTARFVAEYSIQLSYGCKMAVRRGFEPRMQLLTAYSLSRGAPSASRPPHHTPLTSASKNLFLLFVAAMAHILLSGTYKSNLFSRPFFRLHTSRAISL